MLKIKVIVTGSAGFIGSYVIQELINRDYDVLGIDNFNDYYNPQLKKDRVQNFGKNADNFRNIEADISDPQLVNDIFKKFNPDFVIHLAAQAGVGYSKVNPKSYIDSNILGFFNILNASEKNNIKNIFYASSSSVYANNNKLPFSENDSVDKPISLYAATKKSNELIAHVYSKTYGMNLIGLRFFTVYGPWGRPDMAIFKFTDLIAKNKPIDIYNNGNHSRDFTYIEDIIDGIFKIIDITFIDKSLNSIYEIYNIGNSRPTLLMEVISILEETIGKKAVKNFIELQSGDVLNTYADISKISKISNYHPKIDIKTGIYNFYHWYQDYYKYNLK